MALGLALTNTALAKISQQVALLSPATFLLLRPCRGVSQVVASNGRAPWDLSLRQRLKAIGIISETTQASREPALAGLLALSARKHGG